MLLYLVVVSETKKKRSKYYQTCRDVKIVVSVHENSELRVLARFFHRRRIQRVQNSPETDYDDPAKVSTKRNRFAVTRASQRRYCSLF